MATFILFIVALILETGECSYKVYLSNNGPAVRGSNVTFTAVIPFDFSTKQLKFVFSDDASPQHETEIVSTEKVVNWTVEYNRNTNEPGQYKIELEVKEWTIIGWYNIVSNSTVFNLTDNLHGGMVLHQNETERPNDFVAVNQTVTHIVIIPDHEMEFLLKNSSSIETHWFIDCAPYTVTREFHLNYTYTDGMSSHDIEAIVVANTQPEPPLTTTTPTPPTTTPKPNTTTEPPPTTTVPTSTLPPHSTSPANGTSTPSILTSTTLQTSTLKIVTESSTAPPAHNLRKREVSNRTTMKGVKDECHIDLLYGKNDIVGRYHKTIGVRVPISAVNISGSNWLQHGDLLHLKVKFAGSPPFDYCILYKLGQYNITGNETCNEPKRTVTNEFELVHYFADNDQHTVVVVIENEVTKTFSRATINIYKVTVHAQLSVIVVPVFFCLVAVILVVFGIAYYQHRSRHTIEVADFDFGQANLDYKTFTERLRDSFSNAFNFRQRDDTDPLTPNIRYDSMT